MVALATYPSGHTQNTRDRPVNVVNVGILAQLLFEQLAICMLSVVFPAHKTIE